MVRGAWLVLLLAGCSSESMAPAPPDLAVPVSDLAPRVCTLVFTGDESSVVSCYQRFCRSAMSDAFQVYGGPIGSFASSFAVDGGFTLGRTYAAGDLSMFDVHARFDFTTTYVAGSQVAGSTVALTFAEIEPNSNLGCASGNVTAHGTARVVLIEQLDGDAGVPPAPGHVTLDVTF